MIVPSILLALQDAPRTVVAGAPPFSLMDGGVMMYPILLCALLVLGLAAWSATRLWGDATDVGPRTRAGLDSVLFWGVFALILGVLGTLIGVMVAAQSIEMAGEIHGPLIWGGIKVALITTVVGTLILTVASLLWWGLRLRWRSLVARAA